MLPRDSAPSNTLPAELIAFSNSLIHTEKSTSYEVFELTLSGDLFTETFYCAFDIASRRLIVKLSKGLPKKKATKAVSTSRICSQLATALCAYAEHFDATSVHVAVPKGHREYAAWMRSCLYVGLKLQSVMKAKRLFNENGIVILSLKMVTSSPKDNLSVAGTDSTCEGWSPAHSDVVSEASSSEYFLDLSA